MSGIHDSVTEIINISDCEQEAIHLIGAIQPHGVLLVLQEPHLKILQVSDNTEFFLGIAPQLLINKNLDKLFSFSQIKVFKKHILQLEHQKFNNIQFQKKSKGKLLFFNGLFHRSDGVIILELEPASKPKSSNYQDFYYLIKSAFLRIKQANDFNKTTELIVQEVRQITGYDRVLIYRFEADLSGVVIAEDKREDLTESYLGLHYPATDIPTSARELFYKNWLRLVVDINYQPVELIPLYNPLTDQPLDLTFSCLRSVSPCHIQYLKNMGVSATMVISLIDEKKLWGLIVCDHYSPKYVDYKIRNYCALLGQLISLKLVKREQREAEKYRQEVKITQNELKNQIFYQNNSIISIIQNDYSKILELVKAQGLAIDFGEDLILLGQTPPKDAIRALISEFLIAKKEEVFSTHSLSEVYPPALEYKDIASGLLAISIFFNQTSYHLLWFRPEIIQTVKWGGNPNQPIAIEDQGKRQLSPRRSFELWQETVRNKSLPWQQIEIESALELRNTFVLAALKSSQSALQEAAERSEIANIAKSQFLAKMSHELRTPLNAILGFTQLLNRDNSLNDQQREHLEIINRSGEHLLSLINDVLEMSKIEAGQQTLNEHSFDLYNLLETIYEMFYFKASDKQLNLIFQRGVDVPQYIVIDENKLRQVLINLLENAIKFTKIGTITLRISYGQEPNTIIFDVCDTGAGIAADELESLFEPFIQTETGRQSMQGTGLGLPISRQFVRMMGGDLSVNSIVSVGSTFTFNIPVRLAKKTDVFSPEITHQIIGLAINQPNYRILVVEDVEENRTLLLQLLGSVGFEVKAVENGQEAIACWQAWQPQLILMDMRMPVMDGYEATRQIKAYPNGQETIIIAITATAFSEERKKVLKAGCDDFIPKPYREEHLLGKIAQHLKVAYSYQDNSFPTIPQLRKLTPDDFKIMPSEWIKELRQAVLVMDESRIIQMIEKMPETNKDLATYLKNLVDSFHLDLILDLTSFADE